MTVLLANTATQAESLLNSLEQARDGIGLHVNADKMEFKSFNKKGDNSTLNGGSLKSVDKFTNLGSSVSSTESDINMHLAKARTVIDRLYIIWKSNLSDKIKRNFFQAAVVSILLYGCTTWTLTEHIEKKLGMNRTIMLWGVLNEFRKQHPTKEQLYCHLPPISKTIQIKRIRHTTHCRRSKD